MISLFLNRIADKQHESITNLCCDDMCFEIFRQVAGNFETTNLNKLVFCQLTSRKVYILLKPLWRLIRIETGMNVSWQVCTDTTFPETYNWMLNQRLLTLIKSSFKTSYYKPLSYNPKLTSNAFQDCEFLLTKSPSLANSFSIITGQKPPVLDVWERLKGTVFDFFSIKETHGEQILQLYVNAKKNPKGELSNLNKLFNKGNFDTFPFLMKTFLSLNQISTPLLEKGVVLWKSGKKGYLEIMIEDIWESSNAERFFEVLKKFHENSSNRVGPVSLIYASKLMTHLYNQAMKNHLSTNQVLQSYEWDAKQSIKSILGNIKIDDLSERLLNLIAKFIQNYEQIDSLEESSPITDLFLPFLLKRVPQRTSVWLLEIKQKIRSRQYFEATASFIDYLKVKYDEDPESTNNPRKLYLQMTEDEREILHCIHLKLYSRLDDKRAKDGFRDLIISNSKTSSQLHIRYTFGLIEAYMLLGKWNRASDKRDTLFQQYSNCMRPEQKSHNDIICKIITIFQESSLNFASLCETVADNPDILPLSVKLILKVPFKEEYLILIRQLLEKGITLWIKGENCTLGIIIEILWNSGQPWLLNFLTEVCKNPTLRIPPIVLFLAKEFLHTYYQKIDYLDQNLKPEQIVDESRFTATKIKELVSELIDCKNLSGLHAVLQFILSREYLDSLTDSSPADEFLPLLLKIHPKPDEVILLEAKQKFRSKQFDEALVLFRTFFELKKPDLLYSQSIFGGELLYQTERYEDAYGWFKNWMGEFKQCIEKDKDNLLNIKMFVDASIGAAKTKLKLNEPGQAKKICDEMMENILNTRITSYACKAIEKIWMQSKDSLSPIESHAK